MISVGLVLSSWPSLTATLPGHTATPVSGMLPSPFHTAIFQHTHLTLKLRTYCPREPAPHWHLCSNAHWHLARLNWTSHGSCTGRLRSREIPPPVLWGSFSWQFPTECALISQSPSCPDLCLSCGNKYILNYSPCSSSGRKYTCKCL